MAARIDFYQVSSITSWTLEAVLSARDAHRTGYFERSSSLASALRTDDACYGALHQVLSPVAGLPRVVEGGNARVRGEVEAMRRNTTARAKDGSSFCPPVAFPDADLLEGTILCGFQVAQMIWTPSSDGRRLNFALDPWPTSRLTWCSWDRTLRAQTTKGLVPVVHGDGTWIVCQQRNTDPWDAGALIPLASCWASRAYGWRDLNQSSESLGMSKLVGTLPQGIDADSAEGQAFLEAVKGLYRPRSGALIPNGADVKYLQDTGGGWQIHREVISGRDKAIARILLGSDGTTQASGGDYRKSAFLWGVRQDRVEAGLRWLSDAYDVALGIWSERNFGRDLGLHVGWLMPDPDEDARIESLGARTKAYCETLESYSRLGILTQEMADELAKQFRVPPVQLKVVEPAAAVAPALAIAPAAA